MQKEKSNMKTYLKYSIPILLALGLYTCVHHHKKSTPASDEIVIAAAPLATTLYYSAIIEPLKTRVVTAQADGVIDDMLFHFGDEVKSGQLLFTISSDKFQIDYKAALMQYIKNKTDYANSQSQMNEATFLHKNQLISDDDYKAKQIAYYNARLAMVQAKDALDNMQKQIDLHGVNLYDLKIEDIDKITRVLHEQNALRQIHIVSPGSGIILLPNKTESGDGELKKISKGDAIKQGDVIAVIGDVNGLTLHINVNEFNINQIKLGQQVKVTGAAFPDFILAGEISAINRQGEATQGGLPIFPVEIIVPKLTAEAQNVIHMGMTAKVAIELGGAAKITVPIRAVIQRDGKAYVNIKDAQTGKVREAMVKTGETTLDSVVIDSSLTPGEIIVIPH